MTSLLLVGHGNMGSAMLASWQKNSAHGVSHFYVSDIGHSNLPVDVTPDIIVFAVKPQELENILPEYKNRFGDSPLYISVAAGKTLAFYAKHLGADARVVRAMPNTPALIGKAITALCASENISHSSNDRALAMMLTQSFGSSIWVAERDMDAVTAVSGSGPAYVFLFLDALIKAGVGAGLAPDVAKTLALEMMKGSLHLSENSSESFEQLRKNVTSKGGTTEAALNVLMKDNALEKLLGEAVQAAVARSKALL